MIDRRDLLAGLGSAALLAGAGPVAARADDWLDRWLAAFNDAGPEVYPDFVRRWIPSLVPYLNEDLGVREASGGFELLRRETTGERETTAWVRDRTWDRFSRVVLTAGTDGIEDLSFLGAAPPEGFGVARTGIGAALEATRRKLSQEAAAGRFSGTVLVARGGEVLMSDAYGHADAGGRAAVTPETRFCIGSMGKMFTAVGALQLVQAGRMALDDTVADLLADYPPNALSRAVTVEHLLTHTGGTGDFFGPDYDRHAAELKTPSDFIRLFGERAATSPPGERWGYSNFGFILLGAMIERVSGMTWDACLEERVFRPAGMTATSPTATPGDTATPLVGAAATGLIALPPYVGLPAGGGYSTTGDLLRFAGALGDDRLLDARRRSLLTTPRVPAGTSRWSLGLRVGTRNGATYLGHGGAAPGVNGDFALYPDSGHAVIVMANRGHPHAASVAEFIGARLPAGG